MTFSIVVREPIETDNCCRFGAAVTTNNPGIGVFAPFVSEHGAVATQYRTYGEVGPRILDRIADGTPAADAIPDVATAVDHAAGVQAHGLCQETIGSHQGGRVGGEHTNGMINGPNYSVAGNTLKNFETLDAVAESYRDADADRELADRLLEALCAGDEVGGDARTATARSAAVRVVDPEAGIANEWYNDLRVDASETPLADIQEQYALAKSHHEAASEDWD